MEWIYDIVIVEVGGSGLVSDVYRVRKRKIPYRECFILSITCLDAAFIFVVQLRKARCHLSGARAGCGNYDQWSACFKVFVLAIALIAYDMVDVVRVAGDRVMQIACYPQRVDDGSGTLQPLADLRNG